MHINREHKENIPSAGRAFVLACLTESNVFTNVTWMGPDGTITSGNGITLHVQKENETTVKYLLMFLILMLVTILAFQMWKIVSVQKK